MQRTPRTAVQRRLDIALIALAALTAIAVLTALFFDSRPAQSAAQPTYTAPAVEASEDSRPTALYIGDSYTHGTGAPQSERWTTVAAKTMGWREVNRGLGGTGYATTSGRDGCGRAFCAAYPDNIEATGNVGADVVIIAGGQNDFGAYRKDSDAVEKAITATYQAASEEHPDARLVAVGPSTPGDIDDVVRGMDAAVQRAAEDVGADYVSLIEPEVIQPDMMADDGGHVGPEGHAAIAERVATSLR